MLNCKNTNIFVYIAKLLFTLLLITLQKNSENFTILKRLNTRINFMTKFPKIKPQKCLKTSKLFGGDRIIRHNTQDDLFHIHNKIHIIEVFQD